MGPDPQSRSLFVLSLGRSLRFLVEVDILNITTYCARESYGQKCPVSEMIVRLRTLSPAILNTPVIVDDLGLPRYWATVWASFLPADLAPGTLAKKLNHLDSFYQHADSLLGAGALDDALADFDVDVLGGILEGYFFSVRNSAPISAASEERWQLAIEFVTETSQRRNRNSVGPGSAEELHARLKEFELVHAHLHIGKRRRPERIRSLPAEVLEFLYELLDPESTANPFRNTATRWRVYVSFILMLHEGLRRGELLIAPVDVIKTSFDRSQNRDRFWMNVRYNEYEDDPRYSRPGIKNAQSIRQIPVSSVTAAIIWEYTANHRGRVNHSYLINSQKDKPLSPEGVTYLFQKISDSLPRNLRNCLRDYTGEDSVSAHDLRHTCAVVRLNQILSEGVEMDDALQRMRTFFGWSRESVMPLRYARAVFEDRLASIWKSEFDDRVAILRSIPGRPQ
jgi:integrase